jgi:hypothetical protein
MWKFLLRWYDMIYKKRNFWKRNLINCHLSILTFTWMLFKKTVFTRQHKIFMTYSYFRQKNQGIHNWVRSTQPFLLSAKPLFVARIVYYFICNHHFLVNLCTGFYWKRKFQIGFTMITMNSFWIFNLRLGLANWTKYIYCCYSVGNLNVCFSIRLTITYPI